MIAGWKLFPLHPKQAVPHLTEKGLLDNNPILRFELLHDVDIK